MQSKIIIASGIWNLFLAFVLLCPPFYHALGIHLTQPGWGWLIAVLLFYTCATLVISGSDVKRYGSIIIYEGVARFLAAVVVIFSGLYWQYGVLVVVAGCMDIVWGISYMIIVPRMTGCSINQLLLNKLNCHSV